MNSPTIIEPLEEEDEDEEDYDPYENCPFWCCISPDEYCGECGDMWIGDGHECLSL